MANLNLSPGVAYTRSFSPRESLSNLLGPEICSTISHSVWLAGGHSNTRMVANDKKVIQTGITANFYMQYPIASVIRTADEIRILLQRYVLDVPNIISRTPTDPYEGPWPLITVSPAEQNIHSRFSGLSGNPDGIFNKYAVRYVGLPKSFDLPGTTVQEAEEKFWYHMELIFRAFKRNLPYTNNLNGTVMQVADEMSMNYSETGPYIFWRGQEYVGGVMIVSVFERYRNYGV